MSIINAFLFFNELLQLELRLNELYDHVDYFILTESTKTHSGKDKPLFYYENRDKFKQFEDKIIHNVLDDTPANYNNLQAKNKLDQIIIDKVNRMDWFDKNREDYCRISWESEAHLKAMNNCKPNDILILDEADELPKASAIEWIKENFDPNEVYNFQGPMYYYYLNLWRKDESPWKASTICSFEKFKTLGLCENRMRRRGYLLNNSSWHFSYMQGANSVKYKIQSHAEQTLNRPDIINNVEYNIDKAIELGRDIYFRPAQFQVVPIDESFPKYLVDNQDKFKEFIKDA